MGTTPLRQFLQSLCCNSRWNYAVFWKLQHQRQMLLTWEDGYCDILKQRESTECILDNNFFKGSDEMFSLNCESSMYDGNLGGYPIGLAVVYMSSVQYAMGDGVVGEVAYAGNHRWVFSDNLLDCELNHKSVPQCPDEWLLQFAAGIKTLLLVPVIPHGVLQLGSFETIQVTEDLAQVAYIKDKFIAHQNFLVDRVPYTENGEFEAQSSSSLMSTLMRNLDELSAFTMNEMKSEDSKAAEIVKPRSHELSTTDQITPPSNAQESSHICGKDMLEIVNSATENDTSVKLTGLIDVPEPLYQSLDCNMLEMTESSMFRFPCLEEELQAFSYSNHYNMGESGEFANKAMNSYSDGGIMEKPLVDKDADNTGHKNVSTFFSFPVDCELHKALGPTFMGQTGEYLWNSFVSGEVAFHSSSLTCNEDLIRGTGPSSHETSGWFFRGDDEEHHLEAVVPNVYCSSDDNSCNRTNNVESSATSLGQFAASSEGQSKVVGKDTSPQSCLTFVDGDRTAITNSSPSASTFESVISALIEEEQQQKKGCSYPHPRKGSKLSSASKRRARLGDNQRSRPRDRQLIQDRVKELRELVPNGAKCSIDGLLDRTIKHMLFLRSVTDRADKLRQWVHEEVAAGPENLKTPETKGGRQKGKSWVFELGIEQQICPIVVEDLEYPGHMLIEMVCNDHAHFLEIAEVIHRLDLTILKGVMKRRADDTWAHFIAETPSGFCRLDIFWPLMQLRQQNQSLISSKI